MTGLSALIKRNTKLFFKDKGMFFTALITPLILLVLYATFLANVFRESYVSAMPEGFAWDEKVLSGAVGGQLLSSLLAVCCITVAFCSNMLMVQDKVTGARRDLTVSPVKSHTLALGYYIATFISTFIISLIALAAGVLYLAVTGWTLEVGEVMYLLIDVLLLCMLGTALSSVIGYFLSSQGQISAVGTIVSAGYGFICGAYMPIASFGEGLQKVLSFMPFTYCTGLVRNHALGGVFAEMKAMAYPEEMVEGLMDGIDINLYFFGDKVEVSTMYIVVGGTVAVLMAAYLIINLVASKKAR